MQTFPLFLNKSNNSAYSHIRKLTGTAASKAQLQQIIYMASRFSDRILRVMNVSGYHAGDNILVEVDIGRYPLCLLFTLVLDEKMPLKDVHDLGEALQYSIESLPGVERAFVHSDYRESNPSGHIRGG
jgi:divalent metal cation (Fe/Co/Zn/Cd) transporter